MGTLPVENSDQEKQTNEIKIAIPLLTNIDLQGKTITADALLTQRDLAIWLVEQKNAHYHFTVKGNQKYLLEDIAYYFDNLNENPNHSTVDGEHGRIETREIWISTDLNQYLSFPYVGHAFMIKRSTIDKKSGNKREDVAYGITSKTPGETDAEKILQDNRGHWCIENSCHYIIDWNFDEDRSRIRTQYGPENISRLRRFAVSVIKRKGVTSVAQKMRRLNKNMRMVFDYLKMTANVCQFSDA